MAKRAPLDEKPYSPVRAALVESVVQGAPTPPPKEDDAAKDGERVVQMKPARRTRPEKAAEEPRLERPRERLEREKRVLLSRSEEAAVGELVQRLSSSGASSLKLSHLLRACILILRHCEKEFVDRVKEAADLVRPPNDNPLALAEFELRLAQELTGAIRATPPLR
jgi:hypothetical protein